MNAKVILTITSGSRQGDSFDFSENTSFLVGRARDCRINLPDDDLLVSRHHFMLDINPPRVYLRDLGSRNGTYINGVKRSSRQNGDSPAEGAQPESAVVELKHLDIISIGETTLRVEIEQPVVCASCGEEITEDELAGVQQHEGESLCLRCLAKAPWLSEIGSPGADEEDGMVLLIRMLEQLRKPTDQAPEIPGYKMIKLLGEGGMGKVFLLRNLKSGNKVALKIQHYRVAVQNYTKEKFQHEIDILKELRHPNLVELYEQGEADGRLYYLTEYFPLGSADQWAEKHGGVLSLDEAGPIVMQALNGLAFMHQQGYVHRDVKPQSILLKGSEDNPTAKLSNFDLAKKDEPPTMNGYDEVDGVVSGTVPFMSRDQVRDYHYCGPTADVWSMGATFYNLLTGEFPRDFERRKEPIQQALKNPVVPVRQRDSSIPTAVAEVIDTALSDEKHNRYQDGSEMLFALTRALEVEKQRQLASQPPEIPGYEAIRQLEEAGMSRVYLLRHLDSSRQVCMKTLDWFRSNEPEFKDQFQREIETMKALNHPNIVEIYEQGETDGIPYILMEYCELDSADKWVEESGGALSLDEGVAIILQALKGLVYLHQQGYVHRDIAPQNILLSRKVGDHAVKLALFTTDIEQQYHTDMLHDPEYDPEPPSIRFWSRDRITSFKHYKPAIDVWSMGATFYNLLTAQYPRDFVPRKDPILQVLQNPVVPVRKRDSSIPKAVAEVIDTALSDDTKARYPDSAAMLASLERALGDTSPGNTGPERFWYD
jgi:serine/threonine protein kinase